MVGIEALVSLVIFSLARDSDVVVVPFFGIKTGTHASDGVASSHPVTRISYPACLKNKTAA